MAILTLVAFAVGFLVIGIGIGITIYHLNLSWFFSHHSGQQIQTILDETESRIHAYKWQSWRREARLRHKTEGRHLVGVPLKASAVEETKDFTDVRPPLESRRL
jgi:hypothetical protein